MPSAKTGSSKKKKSPRGQRAAPARARNQASFDFVLLGVVAALAGLGLVMIFSASYAQASQIYDQSTFFFLRQLRWLALGAAALAITAAIDYRIWQRFSVSIMALTVLLLLAVLFLGDDNLGARRHLLGGSIQPSEIAKLTITIYIAYWLTSKGHKLRDVSYGLVPFAVLLGLVAGLIILQPDFGTTVTVVITALTMFFVAGADPRQLLASLAVIAITMTLAITRVPYASQRVNDYLEGLRDLSANSDHVQAAVMALASGGWLGTGLGDSQYKFLGGVPLPWSDSIFAIVGEELGLVGALAVIALFMALAYRGLHIALGAKDRFGMVLGCGITAWLSVQAVLNIAVNTATLPFSGMTLPFISYGGSSLLASMAGIGVLLSISRYGSKQPAALTEASRRGRSGNARPQPAALGSRWRNWRTRLPHLGSARRSATSRRRRPGPAGQPGGGARSAAARFTVKTSSVSRPAGLRRTSSLKRRLARARTVVARRRRGGSQRRTSGSSRRIPRRR